MTIANSNRIIIVANIFDTDIQKLKKNSEVIFQTDIFPDKAFKGVVTYISDVEDADSKTVKTFITIKDGRDVFKQNMFVKIRIMDSEKILLVIPKTAIIYKDGKFYVKTEKDGKFELKEIRPGKDVSDKTVAVEGVNEGERIVYSAIETETP